MDLADDVVLGHVGDFVRHHARQLGFVAGREDETVIDEHVAARHGERIDLTVLDGKELEAAAAVRALRGELRADAVQVLADLGVLDQPVLVAQLLGDHGPVLQLLVLRHDGLRRAAQIRQLRAGGRGGRRVRGVGHGDGRRGRGGGQEHEQQ